MRLFISSLLVIGCFAVSISASQARGTAATGKKPGIHACSLLTKELVTKVTPYEGKALELQFLGGPDEDSDGAGGSDCSYGGIDIQIDPTTYNVASLKKQKGAEPVAGVGDEAVFQDIQGHWAQLAVRSGSHLLGIRMDIPNGKSAAAIKPNTITLAKTLLPMLK
jgi:hypothetical protein